MKISPLFYVLAAFEVLALIIFAVVERGSGAGVFAAIIPIIFVTAAVVNRLKNGTFFTDFSGGN